MIKSYFYGISYAIVFFMALAIVCLLWFTKISSAEVKQLNRSWQQQGVLILKKQKLLHDIKTQLGYTGFIHNFKNYVIRRQPHYLETAMHQLDSSLLLIDQYRLLITASEREAAALKQLQQVVLAYQQRVSEINHVENQQLSVSQLDDQVKVDDLPALRALGAINEAINIEFERVKNETQFMIQSADMRMDIFAYLAVPAMILVSIYMLTLIFRSSRLSHNLSVLIQVLPDGFLLSDERGKIIKSNNRFRDLFGYSQCELDDMCVEDLMAPQLAQKHQQYHKEFLTKNRQRLMGKNSPELNGLHKDGTLIPLDIAISSFSIGKKRFGIALIRDKRKEIELIARTEMDFLTVTHNRMGIDRVLRQEIERSRRYHHDLSLLVIDIDHFKTINDTLGHLTGDSLLSLVADVLKKTSRPSDIVGRWGGDEFCIICTETCADDAEELAQRIRIAVKEVESVAALLSGKTLTLSIGVAEIDRAQPEEVPEQLFARADQALYHSKAAGRDRVTLFCSELASSE